MADIQPLKILFFHPTHTFGGAERTAYNLFTGLNRDAFELSLVSSRQITPRFSNFPFKKVIYVEDFNMGIWFDGKKNLWRDIRTAANLIVSEKPHIAFGMMHYMSVVLTLAKKIFHLRCRVIASPRGPSTYYLKTCFPKKSDRVYLNLLFSFFCRHADGIIVPSLGTKEDCVQNYGARRERVKVINNSIDAEDIMLKSREDPGLFISDNIPVISTAGRLSEEKNIQFLLKAFAQLKQWHDVRLLIIGDGPEMNRLQHLARGLGIYNDVIFTGFQENPYKFIRASDVFVHTCLFEGFGNIMVEAMACGTPVVATDCPYGPREIIQDGENGILVPMQDTDTLALTISSLLKDEKRRKELSEKGIQRARYFSVERMVRAYEEFMLFIAYNVHR